MTQIQPSTSRPRTDRWRRRARRVAYVSVACVLAATLVFLALAGWDVRFAARVLMHGQGDTQDYLWKDRSHVVEPSVYDAEQRRDCAADTAVQTAAFGETDLGTYLTESQAQSLVVLRDGVLVCEWYREGDSADTPWPVFSISKSVTSLLLARAVDDGHISGMDESIGILVPELLERDSRFADISFADLVDMRSGIGFTEEDTFPWVNQDGPSIYFATDLRAAVLERSTIVSSPGQFLYNDYAPNLIGIALERAYGEDVADGPFARLWNDLPAEGAAFWSVDDHGFAWHESGLVATPRDLARLGQSLVEPNTAVSLEYADRTVPDHRLVAATTLGDTSVGYRNGWWNLSNPEGGMDTMAMGNHGQFILVSPESRTVIVRTGDDSPNQSNIQIALDLQRLREKF